MAYEWKVIDRVARIRLLKGEKGRESTLPHDLEASYLAALPEPLRDVATLLLDTGLPLGKALSMDLAQVRVGPAQGAPTNWLAELKDQVITVHCQCETEVAARRFFRRKRHPGFLDGQKSHSEILAGIQQVACMGTLNIGLRLEVNTSQTPTLNAVLREIYHAVRVTRQGITV